MTTAIRTAARIAAFAALALLAEPLTGVADTIVAGRPGVGEQSSLALGASVATTATWLISPILFAQTTEVARLRATGRIDDAARHTCSGLTSAAAFGLILCLGLVAVVAFGDLGPGPAGYLLARAAGLPVMAVVMAGYGALRASNAVHLVAVLALSGAGIHVLLDLASAAWTPLGVTGVGLASVTSQLIVACLLTVTLRTRGLWMGSPATGRTPSAWRQSAGAVGVLAARSSALGGAAIAMTSTAVGISPTTGAAHQVTYQFWLLVVMVVEGWKSAAQILVSATTTTPERLRIESTLMRFSVCLGLGAGLTMEALSSVIIDAMSADPAVAHTARSIWTLSAASLLVGAVAYTRDGIEFGRGTYTPNLLRTLVGTSVWLLGAVATYVTEDVRLIWWAMFGGLAVRAALPFGAFAYPARLRQRYPSNASMASRR